MSSLYSRLPWSSLNFICKNGVRHRWIRRGVAPEQGKSLAQKMEEWNYQDPELHYKVNIGYAFAPAKRQEVLQERLKLRREIKENLEMEKAARNKTLTVPLGGVHDESVKTNRPLQLKLAAEYFGVFQDLFGDAYFTPVVPLDIRFPRLEKDQEIESRVYCGNQITPLEAATAPKVSYLSKSKNSLYTLALTTPDCHLSGEPKEYLHWLIGNIPGSAVEKGEVLCDYMRPFPLRGIGFCRYVFVLYKQDKPLDFSAFKRTPFCLNLSERTFSTYDFYREFQDFMTPAGLAFFQSNWDQSLTSFFHNVLDMKEPCFEYDFKTPTLKPQEWFPIRKPFNLYMDKYKDPKVLQKELLLEKLKERHPFKPPPKPSKYPLAHRLPLTNPSWLNDDIRRKRMREGKYRFM